MFLYQNFHSLTDLCETSETCYIYEDRLTYPDAGFSYDSNYDVTGFCHTCAQVEDKYKNLNFTPVWIDFYSEESKDKISLENVESSEGKNNSKEDSIKKIDLNKPNVTAVFSSTSYSSSIEDIIEFLKNKPEGCEGPIFGFSSADDGENHVKKINAYYSCEKN